MKWTISVPVWGNWHTKLYLKHALPRHLKMGLKDCRYILHTNAPDDFKDAVKSLGEVCEVHVRPLSSSSHEPHRYRCMNECHHQAMQGASAIMFLPPDCVISPNLRTEVEASKKNLVMMCSLRTLGSQEPPEDPIELNEWAVKFLHPSQKGWIWGHETGTGLVHAHTYFTDGTNFWAHAFHLHPVAVVLDGRKTGSGKSIDSYLPEAYSPEETWVVSNSEMAMAELTPPEKFSGLERGKETVASIVDTLRGKLKSRHREFFRTPIRLRGTPGNTDIPQQILGAL